MNPGTTNLCEMVSSIHCIVRFEKPTTCDPKARRDSLGFACPLGATNYVDRHSCGHVLACARCLPPQKKRRKQIKNKKEAVLFCFGLSFESIPRTLPKKGTSMGTPKSASARHGLEEEPALQDAIQYFVESAGRQNTGVTRDLCLFFWLRVSVFWKEGMFDTSSTSRSKQKELVETRIHCACVNNVAQP